MTTKNRNGSRATMAADQAMIDGIVKHMGKAGAAVFGGENHKASELVAMLKTRIEKSTLADGARDAWRKAATEKNAWIDETDPVLLAFKRYLLSHYGASSEILADFGLVPKAKKTPTLATKYHATEKAKATRAARRDRRKASDASAAEPTPTAPPVSPKPIANGSLPSPT